MGLGPYWMDLNYQRNKYLDELPYRVAVAGTKWLLHQSYLIALGVILVMTGWLWNTEGFLSGFHFGGYYVPIVGMLAIISGQLDLLGNIKAGKEEISVQARGIDFIHWALDTFLQVGRFMAGGMTIFAFCLKVILLGIIGSQVAILAKRAYRPTMNEKIAAVAGLMLAAVLGLGIGYVRHADPSRFGWGWALETLAAVLATALVYGFIKMDVHKMKQNVMSGNTDEYPRSMFLKGIMGNTLVIWFLVHQLMVSPGSVGERLLENAGVTFIIVVGNMLYLWYYAAYEYYRAQQH